MIVIAGGRGRLGTQVVRLLTLRNIQVRVLTRDPSRAQHLTGPLVEVVECHIHDQQAVARSLSGVTTLISAIHGFSGNGSDNPGTIDWQGNRTLIQAAEAAGCEHAILLSVHGAAPDHPMDLFRMKYQAEQVLQGSGLAWTIIRPTAYMETWAEIIGAPLIRTGKTRMFGRCVNPINFISVHDVARFVELAVVDPELRGRIIEIGGPENLSFQQFMHTFTAITGTSGSIQRAPLPLIRIMAVVMRPMNPTLARMIHAGVVMDTYDMTFDPADTVRLFPAVTLTPLSEVVYRDYVAETGGSSSSRASQAQIA